MALKKYRPIACSFHDIIEHHAVLGNNVEVCFQIDADIEKYYTKILDMTTKAGEEFLHLKNGQTIRLDHIISINGSKMSDHSC
jgi:Rho-binding antiterminator